MSSEDLQDSKNERKSLKTIQRTASDTENLVGRSSKNLKNQLSHDSPVDNETKKKSVSTKETQVSFSNEITVDDLTNPDASLRYWKTLAKKRDVVLQETLEENNKLRSIVEELMEENTRYKVMLEEANSFVEVIKEELSNGSKDDTGIDVNDISTADDNSEDAEPKSKTSKTDE